MAPQSSISNIEAADLLSIYSERYMVIRLLQILFISITPFLLRCKAHSEETIYSGILLQFYLPGFGQH